MPLPGIPGALFTSKRQSPSNISASSRKCFVPWGIWSAWSQTFGISRNWLKLIGFLMERLVNLGVDSRRGWRAWNYNLIFKTGKTSKHLPAHVFAEGEEQGTTSLKSSHWGQPWIRECSLHPLTPRVLGAAFQHKNL